MGTVASESIAENIHTVLGRMRGAAVRAGRRPDAVRLIAATKNVPVERVRVAVAAGVHGLGESRLQEALPKLEALRDCHDIGWHFIGRLQRRKVKAVVGRFTVIHSVDSIALAEEINRRASEHGLCQPVLLEVNVGGEATKAGVLPDDVEAVLVELDRMASLAVKGLMAVPPIQDDAEATRPYFRRVRELAHRVMGRPLRRVTMEELSMGMSHDFEVAIEEGATMVRIGTAIFGERPPREGTMEREAR